MTLYRLMGVSGALFVVFGLLLAVTDSPAAKNTWGGLSIASLGTFAFAMAADGISKGKIRLQFNVIEQAKQPRLFWAVVTLIVSAGIVVVVSAIWVLFFKTN